jgi:hypothetical protein
VDDASTAHPSTPDAPPDARPDDVRPEAPVPSATVTVAPTEVLLELPATPGEMRPSLIARDPAVVPGVEPDGLDALDAPLRAPAPAPLDTLRAEALRHLRQEGSWRFVLRALGVLLAVLLAFRLAFDEGLPRLLLAALGGALGLAVTVLLLHHLNETRRQENLLAALTQLSTIAREHPAQAPFLAPHLEAVLTSLRTNAPVWPPARTPDGLAPALTRALAEAPSNPDR